MIEGPQATTQTGGRPLINGQRELPVRETAADVRSFYWLGFTPHRAADDTRHHLEVKLNHPEYRVRSRAGYVDSSRRSEVTMMVEGVLLLDTPRVGAPLAVEFGPPAKAEQRGIALVPLVVRIPIDQVRLVPEGGRHVGQVEVRVSVLDDEGNRSETPVERLDLAALKPPAPGDVVPYHVTLQMRRRPHRVVVAVYDVLSESIFSTSEQVDPSAP